MRLATGDLLATRLAHVRGSFPAAAVDALIVGHLPNVFYLTNFPGSAGILVVTPDAAHLITDFRYQTAAAALVASDRGCPGCELVLVDRSYDEALAGLLNRLEERRIGFEAARLSVARYEWLVRALGTHAGPPADGIADAEPAHALVPTERLVERARLRKDEYEIETLRAAGRLLGEVARQQLARVKGGRTERQIAADIDWAMRRAGFERPAFDTIVASGPHAALPHARPESRRLRSGDLVVLDFGGVYDGYCVDLSRTVSIGSPDVERRRVYGAVADAHQAAIAAVKPGVPAWTIDQAARDALARHGLAEHFGHGTGHGLGIEVHEEPRISRRQPASGGEAPDAATDERIEEGMVFTIEPGAYLPGRFGVRIEDDVLVTAEGCDVLTEISRDLLVR